VTIAALLLFGTSRTVEGSFIGQIRIAFGSGRVRGVAMLDAPAMSTVLCADLTIDRAAALGHG